VLFGGMLVYDNFTIFIKIFLYASSRWSSLDPLDRHPDKEDSADFYVLYSARTLA